jgi:hypothetical protein
MGYSNERMSDQTMASNKHNSMRLQSFMTIKKELKLFPQQAVEAYRFVRSYGSHIV